jgi:hypothetical protein
MKIENNILGWMGCPVLQVSVYGMVSTSRETLPCAFRSNAIVFHLYHGKYLTAEGQGKKIPVFESIERIVVLIPGKLGYESVFDSDVELRDIL